MQRLHIFRAGTHGPMGGGSLSFSAADLAASASAYDPAKHEAPIVVGHPTLDAPAYGWVGALQAEGGDLFAAPRQVETQFAELVTAGRFKKISASFYTPKAAGNPVPGVFYLKHVGFLGAVPPAVKGLRQVEFSDDGAETVTVEFAEGMSGWRLGWLFADVAGLLRGARDALIEASGAEAAEKLMPGATVQRIAEEAVRLQAEASAEPVPAFADPSIKESSVTDKTADDLARREAALAEKEAAIAAREAEAIARENASFAEGLVKAGKLPQGLVPRALGLLAALPAEGEVSFAEGAKTLKEAPRDAFRAILSALPAAVNFGEATPRTGPGQGDGPQVVQFAGHRVDADRLDLHNRALAYQKAHPNTDYLTAVNAVDQAG